MIYLNKIILFKNN